MKTLYKKDSKDKIRTWSIWTVGGTLAQESGLLGGKLVKHLKVCTNKNVGRSNETSPMQQALLEMDSEYLSKLTEGYFETKKEAENEVVILPMLASDYFKHSKKIDWNNCYIQSKLDGMRCISIIKNGNVTLKSRDGKIIENMDHICLELTGLEDQILDGELYCHGKSFQENMKLIKKYRKGETENISYHVYDFIDNSMHSLRFKKLETLFESNSFRHVTHINSFKINSEDELKKIHIINIKHGYEGSIIRHGNKPYEIDKRSDSLLKYKDFSDIALPIIDITPNESNPLHGTPHFELNGKRFKSGCKMSHDDRADFLLNKQHYIGKTAEIRYFELTDDGIPRFPVMVGIRLDK